MVRIRHILPLLEKARMQAYHISAKTLGFELKHSRCTAGAVPSPTAASGLRQRLLNRCDGVLDASEVDLEAPLSSPPAAHASPQVPLDMHRLQKSADDDSACSPPHMYASHVHRQTSLLEEQLHVVEVQCPAAGSGAVSRTYTEPSIESSGLLLETEPSDEQARAPLRLQTGNSNSSDSP